MSYRSDRPDDDTYVVERREQVVERPVARPVYDPSGQQVNVNAAGGYGGVAVYSPGPLYYARRVIGLLFTILIVLLVLRIVLLALGANQDNGLVNFVMAVTEPFVRPFNGVFSIDAVRPLGTSVLDIAALVAIVGYFLLMALILAIVSVADRDRATV